jgi:hypothetical protein
MTKITLPIYLHALETGYSDPAFGGPYSFHLFGGEMASCGYIPLGTKEIEFDVPTAEQIVARHAVLLREKIKQVNADAIKQVGELREQLSKLESLTYTPLKE